MPKGALIPIPIFIGVAIGRALDGSMEKNAFMALLKERFSQLNLITSPKGDQLVADAGFEKLDQFSDEWGIFSVSIARRK